MRERPIHLISGCKRGTMDNDRDFTIAEIADKPAHYQLGSREVIDVIREAGWLDHYLKANMLKYILRCEHKDSEVLDIQKALKCAALWLEEFSGEKHSNVEEDRKRDSVKIRWVPHTNHGKNSR